MALGGRSRPRWPPEMFQLEKAGLSGTIGQWPRSSPKKQQQPDASSPPDLRVWRVEAVVHPDVTWETKIDSDDPTPLGCVPGGVFCVWAGSYPPFGAEMREQGRSRYRGNSETLSHAARSLLPLFCHRPIGTLHSLQHGRRR